MTQTVSAPYINPMFGVTQEEVDAVIGVLRTPKYPLYGEQIASLEKEFASYIGTKYAAATSSGTSGLHLALIALGIGPGDEVITPSHSFHSVADCVLFVGAKPVFCDIEYDSYNMDPEDVRKRVTPRTKALIPVDLNGHPSDKAPLMEIAAEKKLFVLEDACHALGAKYKGRMVGTFGDVNMFSFAPGKHITSMGDGGMMTTNNEEIAEKIRMLANHGRGPIFNKQNERGLPAGIGNDLLGYNYRMNEVNAAIVRVQLKRFIRGDTGPEVRREHVKEYAELLKDTPVKIPGEKPWAYHSYCRFIAKAPKRDELLLFLKKKMARKKTTLPYYPPVHLNKVYVERYGAKDNFPVTEQVTKEIISFPMRHVQGHLREETKFLTKTIKEFYA